MAYTSELRPSAEVFVPSSSRFEEEVDDLLSLVPEASRSNLRRQRVDEHTGEVYQYYLGLLKSYSSNNRYGFVTCKEIFEEHHCDVFIHQSEMEVPWHIHRLLEFTIRLDHGRPQAADVVWLPRVVRPGLPPCEPPHLGSPPGLIKPGVVFLKPPENTQGGEVKPKQKGGPIANLSQTRRDEEWHFGTLKSFSQAQGYGFILCEEILGAYRTDVYFHKRQLSQAKWHPGQVAEFTISFNVKNQPQARNINWDPVPVMPKEGAIQSIHRRHSESTIERLRDLVKKLNHSFELGLKQMLDLERVSETFERNDADIDFAGFFLERAGGCTMDGVQDDYKMLLAVLCSTKIEYFVKNHEASDRRVSTFMFWLEQAVARTPPGSTFEGELNKAKSLGFLLQVFEGLPRDCPTDLAERLDALVPQVESLKAGCELAN